MVGVLAFCTLIRTTLPLYIFKLHSIKKQKIKHHLQRSNILMLKEIYFFYISTNFNNLRKIQPLSTTTTQHQLAISVFFNRKILLFAVSHVRLWRRNREMRKENKQPSLFLDFLSVNLLIHFGKKWTEMTIFQSKMDFLPANSRLLEIINDGTFLPRITRENCSC